MPHQKKNHRDSSSSSSSSDRSCSRSRSPEKKEKRRDCERSRSKSCSRSRSHSHSRSRSRSRSHSRSRSKSPHKKYEFCDIYQYFKNRLLLDEQIMLAGSSAYTFMDDDDDDNIPVNSVIPYDITVVSQKIDYLSVNSPTFVRESGVYVIIIELGTAESTQFSIFVNGVVNPITCISTNSGAGQVVLRYLITLQANDNITVNNYSSLVTVNSYTYAGGTNLGNSGCIIMYKISPLLPPVYEKDCLSHKKKKLFKKVEKKLAEDCELMTHGYNIHGSFSNTVAQEVPLEGDVVFSTQNEVDGIQWDVSSPTQVTIMEDGIYNMYFNVNTQTAAQFAITVNGVPDENTTFGSNRGAGQVSSRGLLSLHKGDVLTVRNHSSSVGPVTVTTKAGGLLEGVNVFLLLFKIAPLVRPCIKPVPCDLEKALACLYPKLKNYLVRPDGLQIVGSDSYLEMANSTTQSVNQLQPFYWSNVTDKRNVGFVPGDTFLTVTHSGLYNVFAEVATNEPVQIALAVNGVCLPYTIVGRDSGASRCYLREFISLRKGDIVSLYNNKSATPNVTTVSSGNGAYVSSNSLFSLFKLHSIC